MENIRVVFVCFVLVAMVTTRAGKLKKRLIKAESHLNRLELKVDLAADNIAENAQEIAELNRTITVLEKCLASEHESPLETSEGRNIFNQSVVSDVNFLREEMNKALAMAEKRHRHEIDNLTKSLETVKSENLKLKQLARSEFEALRAENEAQALAEERQRTEMNESLNRELSNLKEWVIETRISTPQGVDAPKVEAGLMKKCPKNWTEYETFCYKDHKYSGRTWSYDEIREECSSQGAYVVDMQNKEEVDFVISLAGDMSLVKLYWIGLQLQESDGTWVWERTGKKAIYTNWIPGRPYGMGECVVMWRRDGEWADTPCSVLPPFTTSFVCKKEATEIA